MVKILEQGGVVFVLDIDTGMYYSMEGGGRGGLKILIAGQVGIGKTSFIDAIFDTRLKETPKSDIKYNVNLKGVDVTVFDIPGLNDPEVRDEVIIQEMARVTEQQVDLIILCFNMRGRVTRADVEIIKNLTLGFDQSDKGATIWTNTMCVLTFANEVVPPPNSRVDPAKYFDQMVNEFEATIRTCIQKNAGISQDIVKNIPIIPAGAKSQPVIPSINLNWIEKAQLVAFKRMTQSSKPAMLQLSPFLEHFNPLAENFDKTCLGVALLFLVSHSVLVSQARRNVLQSRNKDRGTSELSTFESFKLFMFILLMVFYHFPILVKIFVAVLLLLIMYLVIFKLF